MNEDLKLYEFLDRDPVKAFHLGIHVVKWFDLLDRKQQYLHSKSLRHVQEEIEPYSAQIRYFTHTFSDASDEEEVDALEMAQYIFNKIVWDKELEETDKVKVALFLGMVVGKNINLDDEELIYNIH